MININDRVESMKDLIHDLDSDNLYVKLGFMQGLARSKPDKYKLVISDRHTNFILYLIDNGKKYLIYQIMFAGF